jgi:RNA polymerase sigma-B factor
VARTPLAESKIKPESSDLVIKQYMPLVNQVARRYARFRPDMLEDLVQVGSIGLLKAIKYYDPERSRTASFKTVASCYIRGEIRHFLRDHCSLVQVPRKFNEINTQLFHLQEILTKELDRAPTVQELSEKSGYSVQDICDAQRSWDACVYYESFDSSDEHDDRDDSRSLSEVVPDKKYQDFQLAAEDRELLINGLKHLGETTRQIIEFVYFADLTQKETAQKLGISEMGVSRAVHSALKKLKDVLSTEIF